MQPYAHTGIYSEGEFAISPGIVQLAAERKLPMEGDWDSTILGKDQGERPVFFFSQLDARFCAFYGSS